MIRLPFLLFFLLLFSACAKPVKPVWTELPTAEQIRQRVSESSGRYTALDGAATVNLNSHGKSLSTSQFLLLEKPDRLRFDVLTGFGQLILQLSSDGEELAVFTNTTVPGHFYRGAASSENLARFTRIPLSTQDMVRLLLYDPPVIASAAGEVVLEDKMLVLRLKNNLLRQDLLFDHQLQLSGCRYFKGDQVFLSVVYQKLDNEKQFPKVIRISMPAEELEASIKFTELLLNVPIPSERFSLKKPDNLTVEPLL